VSDQVDVSCGDVFLGFPARQSNPWCFARGFLSDQPICQIQKNGPAFVREREGLTRAIPGPRPAGVSFVDVFLGYPAQ